METAEVYLRGLLLAATLLPLASFFFILCAYPKMGTAAGSGSWIATGAIGGAFVLSVISLIVWMGSPTSEDHGSKSESSVTTLQGSPAANDAAIRLVALKESDEHTEGSEKGHASGDESGEQKSGEVHHHDEHHAKRYYSNDYYLLGQFGRLRLTISYYIDALTICMFCMVSFIATCIHVYAMGYMHDELHDYTDPEAQTSDGSTLTRPGRYFRFFQYMSLFCFSMLGLVLAGNVAMVFVFWELVGICSYFLIGFYIERQHACNAANKAFIVNRVGDFGMIIGLMAIWSGMGTFAFGDIDYNGDHRISNTANAVEYGIFSQVRPNGSHGVTVPDGMIVAGISSEWQNRANKIYQEHSTQGESTETDRRVARMSVASEIASQARDGETRDKDNWGYILLVVAGVGIFCGCVGKSAQFPLHTWLPDAMEGPTPVSALVHSATMVAAGVYLVGRFYPVFAPEVLLVIAVVGVITLFMAATIAITATDIKRVLAYSTISQLGYMMLALGLGGWLAGMLHLITHAFFKSLLFLCSGSVIHAVHSNDMRDMGGLLKKMPITAGTMLVGCLAIAGMGIPFVLGFSGYYSKDAILEQAFHFWTFDGNAANNRWGAVFFWAAAGGAAITAFYMFRLWFMTFVGRPRDEHRYEHAHESPHVMTMPLVVLAVFAVAIMWPTAKWFQWPSLENSALVSLLEQARPDGTAPHKEHGKYPHTQGEHYTTMTWPNEHATHDHANYGSIVVPVTSIAFGTAIAGILLASAFYWLRFLDPEDARQQFKGLHRFLVNKWWFDELYDFCFVRPAHIVSRLAANFDKYVIDWLIDFLAWCTRRFSSVFEWVADQVCVDGSVNLFASWMYSIGLSLRSVQRGKIREYVMFIVLGTVVLFVLISFF